MKRLVLVIALLSSLVVFTPAAVMAAGLSSLTFSAATVTGGKTVTGTVKLSAAAPSAGQVVSLSSSNASALKVPTSVTIAAGKTSATFTATSVPVTASSTVTITASADGTQKTGTVTVLPAALTSIAVSPTTVVSGNIAVATITLTGKAPTGGIEVSLSSNPAQAPIANRVVVPVGATSAKVNIVATQTTSPVAATLTASLDGVSKTTKLTVTPVAVSAVSVSPVTTSGGSSVKVTVTLNGKPLGTAAKVDLTSSNDDVGTFPTSITVPTTATSASVTITTSQVSASAVTTLTATFGGVSKTASLTVLPVAVSALSATATSLAGGASTTGKVTLTGPAPSGGLVVTLSSSNTGVLTVPDSVTVAAGATTATFTISTLNVGSNQTVNVAGIGGGVTKSVAISVTSNSIKTFALSPTSGVGGLFTSTGTITMTAPAPSGGAVITLTSNNSAVTVPASVKVAAGATTATFVATTTTVNASNTVTITATYGTTPKTATLTLTALSMSKLTLESTVPFLHTLDATVALNGAAPQGGATVILTSSNPDLAAVPESIVIAAGAQTAKFSIFFEPVSTTTSVTITATYGGVAKAVTVKIAPPVLFGMSILPNSVIGGITTPAEVRLTGGATIGGVDVTLSSSNSAVASVPSTFTVPEYKDWVNVPITTSAVTVATTVTITVSYGGATKTASITVKPPTLKEVLPPVIAVTSGGTAVGRVWLTGTAPAGGVVVTLTSSATSVVSVPATVTVPAGAKSVLFTVSGDPATTAGKTASISANSGSVTKSTSAVISTLKLLSLTITPGSVIAGTIATGTVTLNGTAPSSGISVTLESSDSSVIVPSSVTISSGNTKTSFSILHLSSGIANPDHDHRDHEHLNHQRHIDRAAADAGIVDVLANQHRRRRPVDRYLTMTYNIPTGTGGATVAISSDSSSVLAAVQVGLTVPGGAATRSIHRHRQTGLQQCDRDNLCNLWRGIRLPVPFKSSLRRWPR